MRSEFEIPGMMLPVNDASGNDVSGFNANTEPIHWKCMHKKIWTATRIGM